MKKCNYCKEEIDDKAKICPNCRKKQSKLPKWLKILIIIFAVIVVFAAIASDGDSTNSSKTGTTTENLTLMDKHKGYSDGYFYYVEGTIKNNTDREYSYVQVEFSVYDKDNNNLGTCIDNNTNLDANGTWKFKAICDGNAKDIKSYKLKDITGY